MHRALGHAVTWGLVSQNVASRVGPPPVPDKEIQILTEEQIGELLRHLQGRTLRPIVSFLLGTGARRGKPSPCVGRMSTFRKIRFGSSGP
jgi:hypothetical protein